jgi:glutathione synthase/RimK-type ligase-like ATP-grasp enzyme
VEETVSAPLSFVLPNRPTAPDPPRPERFDIVLLGRFFDDWRRALEPRSDLWASLPVRNITRKRRGLHFALPSRQSQRLLFPVREASARYAPRGGWGLFPTPEAIATVGNKLSLWRHVSAAGLSRLMPETWTAPDEVAFPAVLKRTDAQGSSGVVICADATYLALLLHSSPYDGGRFVIQRFVPGPEFTLHGIVVDGDLVWSLAYQHIEEGNAIRYPHSNEPTLPASISAEDIADIGAILRPLSYSGPVNVDYKRLHDGRMAVLEINPRFGGSLFRPQNRADLIAALRVLIANARWLGWNPALRLPFNAQ